MNRTKRSKLFFIATLLIALFFSALPKNVSAAYSAIYGNDNSNDYYQFTGCNSVANLKTSCWNGLIMWALTIQTNGDFTIRSGSITLVSNGVYKGDPNWGANVTNLKTPPTSVTRYELVLGGAGDTSFAHVQSLIASQGTGTGSILYKNFQALKNACPGLDAINNDDESNYDLNSTTALGQLLGSLGMKMSQAPYTNQSFWVNLKNNLGSTCDMVYLQCYQGGAGNSPSQWDGAYGNGFHVYPGIESNNHSETTFASWVSSAGIAGGFYFPDVGWCPGANWGAFEIVQAVGCPATTPITAYLQVNGAAWQSTNTATVPYGAVVNLGPQDTGEVWSWTGPGGFTSTSREIDSIPLSVGANSFTVTNNTQCICNQTKTFTITMQPPATCASGPTTFGNTANGIGCCNLSGELDCCSYNLSQAMTVSSLQIYMGSGTNCHGVLGIYSDNGGSPGTLLTQSNAMLMTSGWNYFAVPATALASGNYWLSASFDGGTANFFYSNTGGGGLLWKTFTYNGSMPSAPGSGFTGYGWLMSIYASGCLQTVPTNTPTNTLSPTRSATPSPTATRTNTPVPPTSTFTSTLTKTNSPTSSFTSTKTNTPTSTFSFTPTRTNTPVPPTMTFTSTVTNSFSPTRTFTPTYSFTSVPPTSTFTGTSTSTPIMTQTFTPSPFNTFTPTSTSSFTPVPPTHTATASFTPTNSLTFTQTPTATRTNTFTATNSSTYSSTPTSTYSLTFTRTNTPVPPTLTSSFTPTNSFTSTTTFTRTTTATWTPSSTSTRTYSPTASFTFTSTVTSTPSFTRTFTASFTPTRTSTPTSTSTPTPGTSTCSGVPTWNGNFIFYATGSKVNYNGELYQCIQGHTSEPNWTPPVVPALWQDLGPCSAVTTAAVYPNPSTSSGTVQVTVPLTATSDVTLEVFSTNFRKILHRDFPQTSVGSDLRLELRGDRGEGLANGLYYIFAQAQGKRWVVKLLVLH